MVTSTLDIKLVINALIETERKNLHTLVLSISNIEDMKLLNQLTFLAHLHIILDHSLLSVDDHDPLIQSADKSTILLIADNLKHFPHLESFTLQVVAKCNQWSDYDKQELLSKIFFQVPRSAAC